MFCIDSVSYTHLDVYKRQLRDCGLLWLAQMTTAAVFTHFLCQYRHGHTVDAAVSYTHLDVYKRQGMYKGTVPKNLIIFDS